MEKFDALINRVTENASAGKVDMRHFVLARHAVRKLPNGASVTTDTLDLIGNLLHEWELLRDGRSPQDQQGETILDNEELIGRVLDCCDRIVRAENEAMACDGPVPKTSEVMSQVDMEYCLRVLWLCGEYIKQKREER